MDPCSAAVVAKMEEDEDLLGLLDVSDDIIREILEKVRNKETSEDLLEQYKDVLDIRGAIERVYEKKYGEKLVWKTKL